MNQRTNNSVLLKRLKGWLALMMAVTMLFGSSMTVLAEDAPETKTLSIEVAYDSENDSYIITVGGITVGDTLSKGDHIEYTKRWGSGGIWEPTLVVDNQTVADSENGWMNNTTKYTYTFDEDVKVVGVETAEWDGNSPIQAIITFSTGDEGEDCDHTGEDCTHKGNDAGSDEEEEPKAEEPKETEEQIFTRELLASVANVKPGDAKAIDATIWHSFSANVLKELLSKEGVSYTFYYNYGGECFYITIPAGAVLEEGCEWYGPLKLIEMFGRTMIDKKDLHAAINQ